jgi:hypothetical protein
MKLVLLLCILLVITFNVLTPIEATYQSDPLNDVWSESSATPGDYVDYVDLEQFVLQGSSLIISTDGDLTTLASNILTHFLVLVSDDGDPTNFEASIGFSQNGNEDRLVYWTISDPISTSGVTWEYDYSGSHYRITSDDLQIDFIEYDGIIYSEILIIAISKDAGKDYYDWIPSFYPLSEIQEIIAKIIPNIATPSGSTPTTTTTVPTTSPPTTSVPPTTTTPPTTTPGNTSPIIIPTTTDEINTTSTTSEITTDNGSLITPGNTVMVGLLAIPSLVIIKRRIRKRSMKRKDE